MVLGIHFWGKLVLPHFELLVMDFDNAALGPLFPRTHNYMEYPSTPPPTSIDPVKSVVLSTRFNIGRIFIPSTRFESGRFIDPVRSVALYIPLCTVIVLGQTIHAGIELSAH